MPAQTEGITPLELLFSCRCGMGNTKTERQPIMTMVTLPARDVRIALWVGAVFVSLLGLRILGILLTPLDLGPDEAQYWRWSTEPAWGYYSKPPLIAWIIGLSTDLFGHSEWAIRLPAPLLHGATALFVFGLGREMFGVRVALWAAAYYLLMPGVVFSSGIITTDATLLPCFAAALYFLWSWRVGNSPLGSAVGFGIAMGLGFLAKYAMVYAVLGVVLAALIDRRTRLALISRNGLLAAAIATLIISPHLYWNAVNGFQTVGHTADNANWSGSLFAPLNGLTFLADQMAVVGPFGLIALIAGAAANVIVPAKSDRARSLRWLLCFVLPALILIAGQAIISRAHANWAATAYVAGSVFIAAILASNGRLPVVLWVGGAAMISLAAALTPDLSPLEKGVMAIVLNGGLLVAGATSGWTRLGVLRGSVMIHAVVAIIFTAIAVGPVSWSTRLGLDQSFKRTRGWDTTTAVLADAVRERGATVLLVDERELWHGLDYYGRDTFPVPVYSWRRFDTQKSFAERADLRNLDDPIVLVASIKPHQRPKMRGDFSSFKDNGQIEISLGGREVRSIRLYEARGFSPQKRTKAWERRYRGEFEP